MKDSSVEAKIEFIVQLGKALHTYGASSMRLEQALGRVSDALGLQGQFFSMPTALFSAFRIDPTNEITRMVRVQPGGVNLEKLALIDELGDQVIAGLTSVQLGLTSLNEILNAPPRYSALTTIAAFAITGGCLTVFLGASIYDFIVSLLLGGFIGYLFLKVVQHQKLARVYEAIVAISASIIAHGLQHWFPQISPGVVILSSLIVLVPGLAITIGMAELATQNLIAGSARLMEAFTILLKMVFGVLIGTKLMLSIFPNDVTVQTSAIPAWSLWPALFTVAFAFTILFEVHPRDRKWVMASAITGFLTTKYGGDFLGPEVGVFLGGMVVGAGSNLFARFINRPASITLLPGIILMVPGSVGFKGFTYLINKDTILGLDTAFSVFFISMGLVAGLLFGNILVTPRKSL